MGGTETEQPEKARRPRGRPAIPKDVQRRRLIEAATRAFEKNEYENTRIADIVAEAGMSSRSFYEFFDSKEDLVASIVQLAGQVLLDRLRQVFEDTTDPIERIDRGLHAFLDLFSQVPVDIESLGGSAGRQVRAMRRDYVLEITDMVLDALEALHRQGGISKPPDRALIELVLTGVEGMTFRYYSEGRRDSLRALHPTVMELLVRAFLV
jgi:AcrR family transcriptional regulator